MTNEEFFKKRLDCWLNMNAVYGLTVDEEDLKKRRLDWFNKNKKKAKEMEDKKHE